MSQFITTFTGKKFYFDHIDPDQICIADIAHALSMLCRFTGHVHQFYSVAQHSLLVDQQINGPPHLHLAALLHDAAEAYVNDLATPLKRYLSPVGRFNLNVSGESYEELHDRILQAVYQKFGVFVDGGDCFSITRVDAEACVFEAEAFLGFTLTMLEEHGFDTSLRGALTGGLPARFAEEHGDLPRQNVEDEFLIRFHELTQMCHLPVG